jgi:hypothetical protein
MLKKLTNNVFKLNTILGVEIILLAEGQLLINCVQLSLKKGFLVVEKKSAQLNSIADIQNTFDNNLPICLSVNGRGILHKKIQQPSSDAQKNLLSILPNARLDDFYVQQYGVDQDIIFSLIRRGVLSDVLGQFKKSHFSVIGVGLGAFAIERLLPLMTLHEHALNVGGHLLEFNANNKIVNYNYQREDYKKNAIKIEDELVEEDMLVAYAVALQSLLDIDSYGVTVDTILFEKENLKQKKIFKTAGVATLTFFLIVLLMNFFLFSHYNARYNELSAKQAKYLSFKTNLDSVNKKVAEREAFLTRAGWMKPSQISYYVDKIGETVPTSILLKELSVNPFQEALTRSEKKLVFASGKINISGNCNKPTDLNPWIQHIKMMDWVNAVEIQNYTFDNNNNKGMFLITILIK